jgi:hypothetical protein
MRKLILAVVLMFMGAGLAQSACTESYSEAGTIVAVKLVCSGANPSHRISPDTMGKISGKWLLKGITVPSGTPDAAYDIDIKDANGAPVGGTFLNNRSQTAAEEAAPDSKPSIVEHLSVLFSNQTAGGASVTLVLHFGN